MKRPYQLIIFFFFCFLYSGGIVSANNIEIPLSPTLPTIPHPHTKAINVISVTATTDGEELAILFSSSVNVSTITLTNETGEIIYQETVNTNAVLDFYIPVGGLDNGNYTLTVQYNSTLLSGYITF